MSSEEEIKRKFEEIEKKLGNGEITLPEAYQKMEELKKEYFKVKETQNKNAEQSWHSFIGNKFQKLVYNTLKGYVKQLKEKYPDDPEIRNLCVLSESDIKKNEVIFRKLAVRYGDYLLLPDTDIVIATVDYARPWNSEILAIVSCKTSLRERIAQACYWKLKLMQSDLTKHINVYLASTDKDKDFDINMEKNPYDGRSRNRIIAEYELDGIYIMRDDFKDEWESEKVKKYEKIVDDLVKLIRKGDC